MPKEPKTVADIADALRELIEQYEVGRRLPTAVELARKYGASRDTVNRAMRLLEAEGLLESRGEDTRGVVVSPSRMHLSGLRPSFTLELKKQGQNPYEANIDEPAFLPAPLNAAKALNVQEGTLIAHRFRVQGAQQGERKIPYRLAENFYPTTLVDRSILEQMQKDEQADTIVAIKEKYGKVIVRVHEDMDVRLPRTTERDLLQISPQTPVIEIRRVNFAEDGTVIMFNKIILVASTFTLSYDYSVDHWKN